jgi:hypothetical protein
VDNIKMDLREVGWDWIDLAQDRDGGGLMWTRWWTSGFRKMLGSCRAAAQLAASQEGLSSMSKWVSEWPVIYIVRHTQCTKPNDSVPVFERFSVWSPARTSAILTEIFMIFPQSSGKYWGNTSLTWRPLPSNSSIILPIDAQQTWYWWHCNYPPPPPWKV